MGMIWAHLLHCAVGHVSYGIDTLPLTPSFCLHCPSHSLWILGHRCTFQSHCHSRPHFGSCRSAGKPPRRIQESKSRYSRVPTSLHCRHTLQTWGDSWEKWMKGVSLSGINMTPYACANVALAMITKCVGNSMHNQLRSQAWYHLINWLKPDWYCRNVWNRYHALAWWLLQPYPFIGNAF